MRHVAPLSPVASVDCAYFPSPRRCTYALQIFLPSRQAQLARPLFSQTYKSPPREVGSDLSFSSVQSRTSSIQNHINTKPPEWGPCSGGSRFFCSPLVTRHSPLVSGQGRCRTERRSRMSFRLSIARTFSI